MLLFGKPRSKPVAAVVLFYIWFGFWLDTMINVSCSYARNLPGGFTSVKWTNVTCGRVWCAPGVCTNAFLLHRAYGGFPSLCLDLNRVLGNFEAHSIGCHSHKLSCVREVTVWSLILHLSLFPELFYLTLRAQRCASLLFKAVGAMQPSPFCSKVACFKHFPE